MSNAKPIEVDAEDENASDQPSEQGSRGSKRRKHSGMYETW